MIIYTSETLDLTAGYAAPPPFVANTAIEYPPDSLDDMLTTRQTRLEKTKPRRRSFLVRNYCIHPLRIKNCSFVCHPLSFHGW